MADNMSLNDILDDTPPPEPVQTAEPSGEPERMIEEKTPKQMLREKETEAREAGKPRTEDGKFAAKEESAAEPEPPKVEEPAKVEQQQMTAKEKALLQAATDERRKRQELEARLAALEKPKEEPKQFWDDPEAALNDIKKEISSVALNTRLNTAETIARSKYQDFDEKVAVFAEIMQQNPSIHSQWLNSPDPAEFAYKLAKNHQDIQQLGSIDAMRQKIEQDTEARVRAKIEAEYKAKMEEDAKTRAALPRSLSDVRGTQANPPVWAGPTSLDDILKS